MPTFAPLAACDEHRLSGDERTKCQLEPLPDPIGAAPFQRRRDSAGHLTAAQTAPGRALTAQQQPPHCDQKDGRSGQLRHSHPKVRSEESQVLIQTDNGWAGEIRSVYESRAGCRKPPLRRCQEVRSLLNETQKCGHGIAMVSRPEPAELYREPADHLSIRIGSLQHRRRLPWATPHFNGSEEVQGELPPF
jgi:hypothetical protein